MEINNWFQELETFEFEVQGFKFSCEEMTTGEEFDFFTFYIEPNGKTNMAKLSLCQATKLISTPFTKEIITEKIGIEKEWKDLTLFERMNFLQKLKSKILSEIMTNVSQHYMEKEAKVKN